MSDVVIQAEGLGKSYLIGHQVRRERYTALRDVLANQARTAWQATHRALRGQAPTNGQEIEEFWALRDVSFEVRRGEVVGIIGRNGAGKSTLLKILSRITDPTSGRVALHGRVASLLEVGTGFHPELTGRENIFLNGALLGMSRAEIRQKFDEIVAFAEVERFLDTPVKRFSSGMYVRLAFAVAAHLEPEILVVDEVLAVGDAQFQRRCLRKMGEVARGGRTILLVSHNMAAITSLCQNAIWLHRGRIEGIGPVDTQVRAYHSDRAATNSTPVEQELGPDVRLLGIQCSPCSIESGCDVVVRSAFRATKNTVIDHACLLVYSSADTRVAVIDLRSEEGPYRIKASQTVTIGCRIPSIDLVEGGYTIGLYFMSSESHIELYRLAAFEVLPRQRETLVTPYVAAHRGYIELHSRIEHVEFT